MADKNCFTCKKSVTYYEQAWCKELSEADADRCRDGGYSEYEPEDTQT
jgi:hypothetical protein